MRVSHLSLAAVSLPPRTVTQRAASAALCAAMVALSACDNPTKPIEGAGDPENISRVTITLTPTTTGAVQSSVIVDTDGTSLPKAPNAPVGTLTLAKGVTYNGAITLLNDLDPNNVVDITAEVRKESNFHRFFYTVSCAGVTVPDASLDLDTQTPTAQPVGIRFQVVVPATAASTGSCSVRVQLRHWEQAKGNGLSASGFDTDLDVTFPASVP